MKCTSKSAPARRNFSEGGFFDVRVLIASGICLAGVAVSLFGMGAFSSAFAQGKATKNNRPTPNEDAPGTQTPDVVRMVGPVRLDQDLRSLPYIPPAPQILQKPLTRYPHGTGPTGASAGYGISGLPKVQRMIKNLLRPGPTMP